jgi:hypothetical protein
MGNRAPRYTYLKYIKGWIPQLCSPPPRAATSSPCGRAVRPPAGETRGRSRDASLSSEPVFLTTRDTFPSPEPVFPAIGACPSHRRSLSSPPLGTPPCHRSHLPATGTCISTAEAHLPLGYRTWATCAPTEPASAAPELGSLSPEPSFPSVRPHPNRSLASPPAIASPSPKRTTLGM